MKIFVYLSIFFTSLLVPTASTAYTNTFYNDPFYGPGYYGPSSQRPADTLRANMQPEDQRITAAIKEGFERDAFLAPYATRIDVYTYNREVTLAGYIDSDRVRLQAEAKAKYTPGVRRVDNQIYVEKTR